MTDVTTTCNACKTEVPGHIPGGCLNCYWIAAFKKVSTEAADLRRDLGAATSFRIGNMGIVVGDPGRWHLVEWTRYLGEFDSRDAALAEARRLEKAR